MIFGADTFNYGVSSFISSKKVTFKSNGDDCNITDAECEYCQTIPGGKKVLKRHNYNWCNYPSNNGCALITGPTKRHDGKTMFTVAHPKDKKSYGRGSWEAAVTLAKSWSLDECNCADGYIDMTATHGEWKDDDPSTHGASYPIRPPVGCKDTYSWKDQETQMGKRGCTDPKANNYDSGAVNDDGSCKYDEPTTPPTSPCVSENRDTEADGTCGSCSSGYVENDDGVCEEEEGNSKTLLIAGGAAVAAVIYFLI